uniref:Uncharacterized protein n=1 Tax=Candidatus Kentrum sp. DK TaxID=2126562 RepID=A0A450TDP4_9GAMM|nr:MAG: hypothetical protein BECKDK2373C_GA0170839_100221 [Candidatus Kentron sp. DK]VFJ60076.1 MAG: hypothetical protein BECKDK2373B_GA0170837_108911 [Candidatus Kentron sp. DK]VFJ65055.1 MAG: hypothetical protein BECKDK2373C_GA0170839_11256 [Candidatus Kentron sp. DK]
MGGRGSRRALFYRYFRLGGSLALPVRLLRCPIANLNLGMTGNHYCSINGALCKSQIVLHNKAKMDEKAEFIGNK